MAARKSTEAHCTIVFQTGLAKKYDGVYQALADRFWMRRLRRMSNDQELRQFVSMWEELQQVQLNDHPDQITWRFIADGKFSVRSAYNVRFIGSISDHPWEKIWTAKVEPKCRFICWLLLQRKILTSDKIIRRGGQANPTCQLCRTENESPNHMVAACSFSKMVWLILAQKVNLQMLNQNKTSTRIKEWWTAMNGQGDDTRRTQQALCCTSMKLSCMKCPLTNPL